MGLANIPLLIRHIILLLLFSLILHSGDASTETNKCLKCHNEICQEAMAKRYIHEPLLGKNCDS